MDILKYGIALTILYAIRKIGWIVIIVLVAQEFDRDLETVVSIAGLTGLFIDALFWGAVIVVSVVFAL